MSKNIFIAGKKLPEVSSFADGFVLGENNVIVADPDDSKQEIPSGIKTVSWNRGSGVSARSAVIQSEAIMGFADDFILYFDSAYFASELKDFSIENCSECCDILISSYQFLALEILNRIKQRRSKSRVIFILKSQPDIKDAVLSPNLRNIASEPSNPFVAAGEAAFATFAENFAVLSGEEENLSVLLISGDNQNEVMMKDSSLASWLLDYIKASDELKNKPSVKNSVNWIKAGAKAPGGFSLFK